MRCQKLTSSPRVALQVLVAHAVGPGRGVSVGAHLADEGQRGTLCALDRVEGVIRVVSIACRIQYKFRRKHREAINFIAKLIRTRLLSK